MANPAEVLARIHQDREEIRVAIESVVRHHADVRQAVLDLVVSMEVVRVRMPPGPHRELVENFMGPSIEAAAVVFGLP